MEIRFKEQGSLEDFKVYTDDLGFFFFHKEHALRIAEALMKMGNIVQLWEGSTLFAEVGRPYCLPEEKVPSNDEMLLLSYSSDILNSLGQFRGVTESYECPNWKHEAIDNLTIFCEANGLLTMNVQHHPHSKETVEAEMHELRKVLSTTSFELALSFLFRALSELDDEKAAKEIEAALHWTTMTLQTAR